MCDVRNMRREGRVTIPAAAFSFYATIGGTAATTETMSSRDSQGLIPPFLAPGGPSVGWSQQGDENRGSALQ